MSHVFLRGNILIQLLAISPTSVAVIAFTPLLLMFTSLLLTFTPLFTMFIVMRFAPSQGSEPLGSYVWNRSSTPFATTDIP